MSFVFPRPITPGSVNQIEELVVLPAHVGTVQCHAFSQDNRFLALGASTPTGTMVEIYDLGTNQLSGTIATGTNGAEALAFHPTSGLLIVTSGNGPKIESWNPNTRVRVRQVNFPIGHQPRRVAFTSSGQTMATGGFDGEVLMWDWNNGNPVLRTTFQAHVAPANVPGAFIETLAFSGDRIWLATGALDSGLNLWRFTFDGKPEQSRGSDAQAGWVHAVGFDATSSQLAVACDGYGSCLRIIELPTGRLIASLSEPNTASTHPSQMISAAVAPREPLVASVQFLSSPPTAGVIPAPVLQFWAITNGAKLHSIPLMCNRVGFSPNGERLLVVRNSPGTSDIPTLWGVPRRIIRPWP